MGCDFSKVYIDKDIHNANSENELFSLIKSNNIDASLFIQPLINQDGKMIKCDNGNLLWNKMKEYGIPFG